MPEIYIHAFSLLSHLGKNSADTLAVLSGDKPAPADTEPGALPEGILEESRLWLESELPTERISRGMITAGALLLPILKDMAGVTLGKKAVTALVLGNATSGLLDVTTSLSLPAPDEPALWLDLELGRPASALARAAARFTPITGPAYVVSTACTAGAKALAEGARLLMSGAATHVIAGGADILNPFTDAGFRALGAVSAKTCKPFRTDRDGLHLGEGGGFFLLSTEPVFNGRPARLKLLGWGETADAHHISAPEPEGRGAEAAMRKALAMGHIDAGSLDFLLLHGTGTQHNDAAESAAVARVCPTVPSASFKRLTGHQLAGAGAFGAALAAAMLSEDTVRPPINFPDAEAAALRDTTLPDIALTTPGAESRCFRHILVNAFAFGGSNVSLLLGRNEEPSA